MKGRTAKDANEGTGPRRRTVAKGVAWSLPAVATIGAAPAYALSGAPPTLQYLNACKYPGNRCSRARKGYAFAFKVNNPSNRDIYICNAVISNMVGTDVNFSYVKTTCNAGKIPAHTDGTFYFYFEGSKDSSNEVFTFTLTVYWGHACSCTNPNNAATCSCNDPETHPPVIKQVSVSGTPPNGFCTCQQPFIDN